MLWCHCWGAWQWLCMYNTIGPGYVHLYLWTLKNLLRCHRWVGVAVILEKALSPVLQIATIKIELVS
jgi:hypothetical protein